MTLIIAPCIRLVTPPRIEKMVCEKIYDPAQHRSCSVGNMRKQTSRQNDTTVPVIPAPSAPATTLLVPVHSTQFSASTAAALYQVAHAL